MNNVKMDAFKVFSDTEWAAIVDDCFLAWTENNPDVRGTTYGDLLDWIEENKLSEPVASLTDPQIGALIRALKIKCEDYGLVYAIKREELAPWTQAFDTFAEALKESEWQDCDIIDIIDITKKELVCIQTLHRGEDF